MLLYNFGIQPQIKADNPSSWWNTSWAKRKPVTFYTNSSSTPQNYQVKLIVWYDSDMNSDFSDLRFIKHSDDTTELDYWIETKSGSVAVVWVEVPDSITTTYQSLVWMYYGNPNASSNSNGENTFEFFDDFSDDLSKWTVEEGYVSPVILDDNNYFDNYLYLNASSPLQPVSVYSDATFGQGYSFLASLYIPFGNTGEISFGFYEINPNKGDDSAIFAFIPIILTNLNFLTITSNEGAEDERARLSFPGTFYYEISRNSNLNVKFYRQFKLLNIHTDQSRVPDDEIPIRMSAENGSTLSCDWVLVRKYKAPEPFYFYGSEETFIFIDDTEPPSQVTGLTVTDANNGKLDLSWAAASDNVGVDFYNIYRDGVFLTTNYDAGYLDSGLSDGNTYGYQISAVDTSGNEGLKSVEVFNTPTSISDTEQPSQVTDLTVTDAHNGKLDLSWDTATDNIAISFYKIYRDDQLIATEATTMFQDAGLIDDHTYVYQVSAVDTSGNEGDKSNQISGTPTAITPVIEYGWVYGNIYLKYLDDVLVARNTEVCVSSETGDVFCAATNRVGEYVIEGVPIGIYTIKAQKNEYTITKTNIEILKNTLTTVDLIISINENRWEIEEAIETGDVGAEINILVEDGLYSYSTSEYSNITIIPTDISKDKITISVEGNHYDSGKTVLINLDNNIFDSIEDISIEYDGEVLQLANDLNDVLNPNDDDDKSEYLIIYGKNITILVSIPNFSKHYITVNLIKEVVDKLGGPIAVMLYIAVCLIGVVMFIYPVFGGTIRFRRKK